MHSLIGNRNAKKKKKGREEAEERERMNLFITFFLLKILTHLISSHLISLSFHSCDLCVVWF
jgi:hypothetical protein